jgi:hypothetical protein
VGRTAGRFAFTPTVSGEHEFCFNHIIADSHIDDPRLRYLKKTIQLELRSGHEIDEEQEQWGLRPVDNYIKKIETTLLEIAKEMASLKLGEQGLRDMNERLYRRVQLLGLVFIVALASVTIWQIMYLKRLFRAKKLM